MAAAAEAKKKRPRKTMESIALGSEPILQDGYTQSQLIRALNWFNYEIDIGKAEKFLADYIKSTQMEKREAEVIMSHVRQVPNTLVALARMYMNGSQLAPAATNRLAEELKKFATLRFVDDDEEEGAKKVIRRSKTLEPAVAYIDELVMESLDRKVDTSRVYETLLGMGLTNVASIKRDWELTLSDLRQFSSDEQLKEGYSHLNSAQRKRMAETIESIFDQIDRFNIAKKVQRKPRKQKPVSVEKLTKFVKYKTQDTALGLTSMLPASILKSKCAIIFNSKTRDISVYYGDSLSIKGTTIIDFDESKSLMKKVRKPEEMANFVQKGTQARAEKWILGLKTTQRVPNGRLGADSLILRTWT